MSTVRAERITQAVLGLDRWFDSMRVDWPSSGYGGPVVHWWGHSLVYRGTGLDWRYEGIVDGYLTLFRQTGKHAWLDKAVRAGRDLVNGQLSNGHFRHSNFERNPEEGGTPHEAAADIALLLLARELRACRPDLSRQFLDAARRNLESYWFGRLWDEHSSTLWDRPGVPSFVPNKAATFIEAILLLGEVTGSDDLIERFALPTGEHIVQLQQRRPGHPMDGAIAQNEYRGSLIRSYFPLYIARCVPPLLRLSEATGDQRFRDAALLAVRFLARVREPDGGFPQVLYGNGRMNRFPRWVAGAGDIVRAMLAANACGEEFDVTPTVGWMLGGARADGRIISAQGFEKIVPLISRRDRFADELGVVGWADKAFRALALLIGPSEVPGAAEQISTRRMSPVG